MQTNGSGLKFVKLQWSPGCGTWVTGGFVVVVVFNGGSVGMTLVVNGGSVGTSWVVDGVSVGAAVVSSGLKGYH